MSHKCDDAFYGSKIEALDINSEC